MKKLYFTIGILMTLILPSCSSQHQLDEGGEVIINGQSYVLTKGFIRMSDPNSNANPRTYSIILANGEVYYNSDRSYNDPPYLYSDNTSQHISFHLYSSEQNPRSVENTTFPIKDFSDSNFDYYNAHMDYSEVCTNVVVQDGHNTSSDCLPYTEMKGQVTLVEEANGSYKIMFSYSDSQNTVAGNFIGALTTLEN